MPAIVLATQNARFHHASLGLRSLRANMGELAARTAIVEFAPEDRPEDAAEAVLALDPKVIGLGVHVWNADFCERLAGVLAAVAPGGPLVLGGPELCDPDDLPPFSGLATAVISGEAEIALPAICRELLAGRPVPKRVVCQPPELTGLALPFHLYDERDLACRTLYVETSRGCPRGCAFCLSSRDPRVRRFAPAAVAAGLRALWDRGARRFKLVDRSVSFAAGDDPWPLFGFFRERAADGLFLHLELNPDRADDRLIEALAEFPDGAVQIEAGIQSFDRDVCARIGRRQDPDAAEAGLRRLLGETGVHIHADLIAGLPGEDAASFGRGFDRLLATGVHEIQAGVLKLLRGTALRRDAGGLGLLHRDRAPHDVLATTDLDFAGMQALKRFARTVDLVVNSGNFRSAAPLLWQDGSPFRALGAFAEWLHGRAGPLRGIALDRLAEFLLDHLAGDLGRDPRAIAGAIAADFEGNGRKVPESIARAREGLPTPEPRLRRERGGPPKRQARHASPPGPLSGKRRGGDDN
jgi:radical SAM superfamily enzyme YgiQ (UPF0313 family)